MFHFYDVGGMAPIWILVLFFGENDDKPCPVRFSSYQCRQRRPIAAVSMANVFYTISGSHQNVFFSHCNPAFSLEIQCR
ncbi:hypothetical protein TNCT_211561 [Trichonephila clavata]|uniref:Uncharacterized protein n=1 Tax=Trichonephila clavata TaxID=2740835 RepID=A0A8X6HNT2_TRICU|nr:hypothetical protein TNCT_211561 [Trichonephila clavata]